MEFLKLLESIRTDFLDQFFLFCTVGGEELFVVALFCLIYWCINKKTAYRILFSFLISGMVVQVLKITFRIPRPWVRDTSFSPVAKAQTTATGYSFPSGHTQASTSVFTTLAYNLKKIPLKILCMIVVVLVLFSRMYLGVHTPADVLTSLCMTLVLTIIINLIATKINLNMKKRLIISIIAALCSVGMLLYAHILNINGIIEIHYVADCAKAAGCGFGFSIGYFIETGYINFSEKSDKILIHILKFVLGMVIVVLLLNGLKLVLGTRLISHFIRYFIVIFYVVCIQPFFIKMLCNR